MTQTENQSAASQTLKSVHVYSMAVICLVVGVALGYLFRGSQSRPAAAPQQAAAAAGPSAAGSSASTSSTSTPSASPHTMQMPSLDQMKKMADKKAEPLLAKLKADPHNSSLLNQLGMLYKATHQFKEAGEYFQRAVDADPKNLPARTDLATCLYYQGNVDGAIQQLEQGLTYDPKDANSLFNLGMIRWQSKKDNAGAVAAWQQLLKANPKLPEDKKSTVEVLIARAQKQPAAQ
ncbi:MAG TPA: tetratricopeptide repeat protein [Candidatus Sulfotelmatobacter sp.]|nr:tetratricopeptide repeat protein [Candidatus Sulfotelmatobacter sp.]